MSAQEFVAAVSALHSPTASAADRHAANAWLIDFAAASEAPQVCAALLAAPAGAAEPALVAAAGLLAEAGSRSGGAAQVSQLLLVHATADALAASGSASERGDDLDDLCGWRERAARPLLTASSEQLGVSWLAMLAATLSPAPKPGNPVPVMTPAGRAHVDFELDRVAAEATSAADHGALSALITDYEDGCRRALEPLALYSL
ncbi:hypothetical protein EMIHUDRAFT_200868 [Emiliania huxleyi CCMP1516]|uniref:Uncharacterized protein n=2 Tax=Emiliania huxleyi TaxID=2903 RepID=A0A0D3KLS3_EMIH1|nr:hypothetical protein EMIHUDRAFT_200868 [Emiliania huxleyi CCMP1516]EOD36708.1 hypothetical protein EMIHUDRAFT_200868 [Emiliania huxleyi CCMP1516]|eukprot:XP_005789137.1 hypothetical protein EMIHUDRAFT_200868 [Emiliania huxleyi CCMP1516]